MAQARPERLWTVRHGQSAGTVARDAATADKLDRIALDKGDEYRFDANAGKSGNLLLVRYNMTAPAEEEGAPVTSESDAV